MREIPRPTDENVGLRNDAGQEAFLEIQADSPWRQKAVLDGRSGGTMVGGRFFTRTIPPIESPAGSFPMSRILHFCSIAIVLFTVALCAPANAQLETRTDTKFLWSGGDGALAVGDFNHDGKMDVALVSKELDIYLGKGDGTFHVPIRISIPGEDLLKSITLADFNGDGQTDIALTDDLHVNVLFGNGDGTFTLSQTLNVQAYPNFITASDLNEDGKPDLVMMTDRSLTAFLNQGSGTFGAAKKIDFGRNIQLNGIGVGDFNRDGIPDVALSNSYSDGEIAIYLGNGDGTFTETTKYTGFVGGVGPIAVGDFRGIGVLDLAVAPYLSEQVNIYLGNGDGTFQTPVSYNSESGISITTADMNGDGKLDIVLDNLVTIPGPGGVIVLLGNGDGTFQPQEIFPTGVLPDYAAVGDFNGDGKPDVVDAVRGGDMFTLLNTGTVNFLPTTPVTFVYQTIGTTSAPMVVQMTNAGTAPITVSSVTVSGPPFAITNNGCAGSLAARAQCKISTNFTPTSESTVSGLLSIVDSASSKPQMIELMGTGTVVKLTPGSLSFPPTKVGTTSAPQTMQVTNTGSTPLNFTEKIYVGGAFYGNYAETNTCPKQLAAGASCSISVTFSPTGTGNRDADLVIQDDGGGSPQEPKLTGTGD
jgi:hypothetical protein